MIGILIKLLIAIFACVTAVLGVSDLKTVRPEREYDTHVQWWRRITGAGAAKIVFAVGTLILLAVNEYLTYASTKEATQKSQAQAEALQIQIRQGKDAIAASVREITRLSRTNGHLVTSLDNSLIRAGISRIPAERIDTGVNLQFENGEKLIPKRGDQVEWTFMCAAGQLPPLPTPEQNFDCADIGYGGLAADAYRIRLRSLTGRATFFGTRSTGEQMTYEPPASGGWCIATGVAMARAQCSLEITVMREARWKFEELQRKDANRSAEQIPVEAEEVCRSYEALYGESCETFLRNHPARR